MDRRLRLNSIHFIPEKIEGKHVRLLNIISAFFINLYNTDLIGYLFFYVKNAHLDAKRLILLNFKL